MGKDSIKVTPEMLWSLPKSQYSEATTKDTDLPRTVPQVTQSFIGALRIMLTRRIWILSTNHPRDILYIHILLRD